MKRWLEERRHYIPRTASPPVDTAGTAVEEEDEELLDSAPGLLAAPGTAQHRAAKQRGSRGIRAKGERGVWKGLQWGDTTLPHRRRVIAMAPCAFASLCSGHRSSHYLPL